MSASSRVGSNPTGDTILNQGGCCTCGGRPFLLSIQAVVAQPQNEGHLRGPPRSLQHEPAHQSSLFESSEPAESAIGPSSASLFERMSHALRGSTHPYAQKVLRKATSATKFIGQSSPTSSTNKYRRAAGDVVFVSAEGARRQRLAFDPSATAQASPFRAGLAAKMH